MLGHLDARHLGVLVCFARFDMHAPGDIVGIGVVGGEQPDLVVDRAGVGDGVLDLCFVRAPIGKDRGADGVFFDDLGDLVGF